MGDEGLEENTGLWLHGAGVKTDFASNPNIKLESKRRQTR